MSRGFAVLLGTLVAASGCHDPTDTTPTDVAVADRAPVGFVLQSPRSQEDDWVRAARGEVDGFAGARFDDEGRLVIALSRPGAEAMARNYVVTARARSHPRAEYDPRFEYVRYDFDQLHTWREKAMDAFASEPGAGVVVTDLDERTNTAAIGVKRAQDTLSLRRLASSAGVPEDGLSFFVVGEGPYTRSHTVGTARANGGSEMRAIWGGQLHFTTLGFNAMWNGKRVFVSNSHNSPTFAGLDSIVQRQGRVGASGFSDVGVEIHDPTYAMVNWLCATEGSTNHYCRWSDSAIWQYFDSIPDSLGLIAHTTSVGYLVSGGKTIDHAEPHWAIKAKLTDQESLLVNEWVEKVGEASGWTKGKVLRTCLRWGDFEHPNKVDCFHESNLYSDVGDSGSPVWRDYDGVDPGPPDSPPGVELVGLLWGGPAGNPLITWFSRYNLVERDLGSMDPCIPGMIQCN